MKYTLTFEDKKFDVEGQLFHFGDKKPYGVKATSRTYYDFESKEMELSHTDINGIGKPAKAVYWLKSYGYDSWAIYPTKEQMK